MSRVLLSSLLLVVLLGACTGGGSRSRPGAAPSPSVRSAAASSIPPHIATWAKDLYHSAGAQGTAAQVRAYVTYAQGGRGNSKALSDCRSGGCRSVFYFDPHLLYDSTVCGDGSPDVKAITSSAKESWYVHETGFTDKSHRVHGHYTMRCSGHIATIPVWALNSHDAGLRKYYHNYFLTIAAGWKHFFMDDTSARVLTQFYGPGGGFCVHAPNHYCKSTQEMHKDADVVAEHGALASALPVTGFFNGINFTGSQPNDLNVLASSSNFIGAICEDCVVNSGVFRPTLYAAVLNAMAKVNHTSGAFVELNHGESPVGGVAQIAQRNITTAMAWLGFSEGHTVVYPDLEANTTRLAIYPENSLYPTTPIQTMTAGAIDIQVAPSVWRREFRTCYNNRVAIGPCAAFVNGTTHNVVVSPAWLHQTYGHTVQLVGGDIPGGGHISLTNVPFHPGQTSIAPSQGVMVVR